MVVRKEKEYFLILSAVVNYFNFNIYADKRVGCCILCFHVGLCNNQINVTLKTLTVKRKVIY